MAEHRIQDPVINEVSWLESLGVNLISEKTDEKILDDSVDLT